MRHPLYRFVWVVLWVWCRLFWRLTVEGRENLPRSGSYIVAPVHRSNIDFAVVAVMTRQRLRYMAKDTLWKYGLGRIWEALGAFPVHRGSADREALRRCMDVIATGEPLVMFPEGTRQHGPEVQPLFDGAAYVAARTGVPIVPVGIGGSDRAMPKGSKTLRPAKVHIVIGKPMEPPAAEEGGGRIPRRGVREMTAALKTEIQVLYDEAQRRAG
jgi:1-acyl-sn-glycerol-3-phosphate acyltransferase